MALDIAVCYKYHIKIGCSTTNNLFLHVLQCAMSINLESVFCMCYNVCLPIDAVKNWVMCANNCMMPSIPNMKDLQMFILS